MRLHRVALRDFRGVLDCDVAFDEHGVTVIEGPNEAGKTSVAEALDLLMEFLDSSQHRRIKSIQPAGRDVGPEAEVEMSTGEYRFVYRKRWLRRPKTTLELTEPAVEQASGRAAHQRVEQLLDETLDRDLWDAMRIHQGAELRIPGFDIPSLGRALDAAASARPQSDADDDLWQRICQERDLYWTSTGRPKRERSTALQAFESAAAEVDGLRSRLERIDQSLAELHRLEADAAGLNATLEDRRRTTAELTAAWNSTEQVRSRVEACQASLAAAEAQRRSIVAEREQRQALFDAAADAERELSTLKDRLDKRGSALAADREHAERTAELRDEARDELDAAASRHRRAVEDRDHLRQQIEIEQLTERRDRVSEAQKALQAAEEALELSRVDDSLVAEIEGAHIAVQRAQAAFDAGASTVTTTALRQVSLSIDGAERSLAPGESHHRNVGTATKLTIADAATVTVEPGKGAHDLAAELDEARSDLRRMCETAGVADLTEARRAAERRKDAQRQRSAAADTIKQDLRDLTPDVLSSKISGLNRRVADYAAARPDTTPMPADFERAKRIVWAAEEHLAQCQAQLEERETAARRAADLLNKALLDEAGFAGQIENAEGAARLAQQRLAAARAERSDARIEGDLTKAHSTEDAAAERLEQAQSELLAQDPRSIEARLENARNTEKRARRDLASNRTQCDDLRIRLAADGEQGLHTSLEEALSRHRVRKHEHEGLEARAAAAQLLQDTFAHRRQQTRMRYVEPFKQAIEELGRLVFGPSLSVEIDTDLQIVGRTLDDTALSVDQLSTGAVEQLGLLARLACAMIVSPDGAGVPIIVDDALGWSDPQRLEGMGAAIAEAGARCQVIVLTCTPQRYANVGNATTVRLPAAQEAPRIDE